MGQFILWKSANATTQVFPLPPSWPTVKYGLACPCVLSIMWPGCSKARLFNSHTYFSPFYLGLSRTTSYHNIEKSVRKNCASFLNSKQRRELQVGKGSGQTVDGKRWAGKDRVKLDELTYWVPNFRDEQLPALLVTHQWLEDWRERARSQSGEVKGHDQRLMERKWPTVPD